MPAIRNSDINPRTTPAHLDHRAIARVMSQQPPLDLQVGHDQITQIVAYREWGSHGDESGDLWVAAFSKKRLVSRCFAGRAVILYAED